MSTKIFTSDDASDSYSSSADESENAPVADDDFHSNQKFNLGGWLCVLGGVCTHLVVGNEYLWGNVNSYVISYFHYHGSNVKNNQASVILPL